MLHDFMFFHSFLLWNRLLGSCSLSWCVHHFTAKSSFTFLHTFHPTKLFVYYREITMVSFLKFSGAYDDEEAAARAYDLAALKYWGTSTFTNFPVYISHNMMTFY